MHHWDENGLFPNETVNEPGNFLPPIPVRVTQAEEIGFVEAWMLEWKLHSQTKEKAARNEVELKQ